MGTNHQRSALRRWRRPAERQRLSRIIKARYQPKALPPSVQRLLSVLADASIDVVNVTHPHRIITGHDFAVFCNDPQHAHGQNARRYMGYADAVGLKIYDFYCKPLPSGDGIHAAIIVGPPRSQEN